MHRLSPSLNMSHTHCSNHPETLLMLQKGAVHFVVRPLQSNPGSLEGAFRVYISPECLDQVSVKVGDLCEIWDERGETAVGYGIAWRATDRMGSSPKVVPAKVTEALRGAFGIEEGIHVNLCKTKGKIVHADKVTLTDVTPAEYVEGHESELDDGKWTWRCGYILSKSQWLSLRSFN